MAPLPPETKKGAAEIRCANNRCARGNPNIHVPRTLLEPDNATVKAEFRNHPLNSAGWVTTCGAVCCCFQCYRDMLIE